MLMVDLSKVSHIAEDINMNHCGEIVSNYQQAQIIFEFDNFKQNDANGKFFSMPNDERTSEIEYRSNQKSSIETIQEKLLNYIETSTILSSVFGFVLSIISIYICYQIIMLIIKSCLKTKQIHVTRIQETTPETSRNIEQELAFLKANLTIGIFPKLPIENAYVEPTSHSISH